MWCRPEPSSVSPMYMPGRLRTASRPFSTLMLSAPYSFMLGSDMSVHHGEIAVFDRKDLRPCGFEQRKIGAGHPGLRAQGRDFLEQGGSARRIQMGGDFVQQQQ